MTDDAKQQRERDIRTAWGCYGNDTNPSGNRIEYIADAIAAAREEGRQQERERACAILAAAEPNTTAERVIERIDKRLHELPAWLAGELADWMNASADELAEFQRLIRAGEHVGAAERKS